ncbi:MAG: hypothetical protein JSR58_05675 [Verrucomicrobia bacterium]|nr:hypothetical protein [Verrucomicrobiota bacterium]
MENANPIRTLSRSQVQEYLTFFEKQPDLAPVVQEVKTDLLSNEDRKFTIVSEVVHRVFLKAKEWNASIYKQYKDGPAPSTERILEVQATNLAFGRLKYTFEDKVALTDYQLDTSATPTDIYHFFRDKGFVKLQNGADGTIDKFKSSIPDKANADLSLRACDLSEVPEIDSFTNLVTLDLGYNKIDLKKFNAIKLSENLNSLNVSYNNWKEPPDNLMSVEHLSLRGNPISKMGCFNGLANLKNIDIAYVGTPTQPVQLTEDFWKNCYNISIIISPGMQFKIPQEYRNRMTFINAVDRKQLQINQSGIVQCPYPTISWPSPHSSPKSEPASQPRSISRFFGKLGLGIIVSFLFAGLWKVWRRARA